MTFTRSMAYICGLRLGRARRPLCNQTFDSWAELADHLNFEHKLNCWITGGMIAQQDLRSDRRQRREIVKWPHA